LHLAPFALASKGRTHEVENATFKIYGVKMEVEIEAHCMLSLEHDDSWKTLNFHSKFKTIESTKCEQCSQPVYSNLVIFSQSMVYTVEKVKPGALGMINKALPNLFNKPRTPFITAKVRDLLFDGIPINCSSKDFATSAICSEIRANPKGLKVVDNDTFLFSFFGMVTRKQPSTMT